MSQSPCNTKHTPGPWYRNILPARKYAVIFAGRNTHVCCLVPGTMSDEEVEGNCNLIAAAPELLEALKNTLRALECHLDNDANAHGLKHRDLLCPCNATEVVQARAIIAKAERKAPHV